MSKVQQGGYWKRNLVVQATLLALLGTSMGRAAAADAASVDQQYEKPLIELNVLGTPEEYEGLKVALGAATRAAFELRWSRTSDFDPLELLQVPSTSAASSDGVSSRRPHVRCWIDLRPRPRARLYFARASSDRFLVRTVELTGASTEMNREALAQIVESSLDALVSDEHAGIGRDEARSVLTAEVRARDAAAEHPSRGAAPPKAEVVTPPAAMAAAWRFRPSAWYVVGAYAESIPIAHGPGVALSYGVEQRDSSMSAGVRAGYVVPQRHEGERLGVQMEMVTLRADGEMLFRLANGPMALGPRLSFGVDLTWLSPRPSRADSSIEPARLVANPSWVLGAALVGQLSLGEHLRLWIEAQLDFDPARVHYDVELGSERAVVLERFRIRPGLVLGATVW